SKTSAKMIGPVSVFNKAAAYNVKDNMDWDSLFDNANIKRKRIFSLLILLRIYVWASPSQDTKLQIHCAPAGASILQLVKQDDKQNKNKAKIGDHHINFS
ncbi:hypothetical protein ACJX0J_029223, partial [Zea mays]